MKKLYLKFIIYELLWFFVGDINIKYFKDNGVLIWDEWVDENGDLGLVYGYQWCYFFVMVKFNEMVNGELFYFVCSVDQIVDLVEVICVMLDSC